MSRETRIALYVGLHLGLIIGLLIALVWSQEEYIGQLEHRLGLHGLPDAAPDAAIPPSDPSAGARVTIPDTPTEEGQA